MKCDFEIVSKVMACITLCRRAVLLQ